MGHAYRLGTPQLRQLLGTLLVAWTLITGCAAVFASALYYRSGDLKILIAYLGAPFLIGTVLFVMVGLSGFVTTGEMPEEVEIEHKIRRRTTIHGLKR